MQQTASREDNRNGSISDRSIKENSHETEEKGKRFDDRHRNMQKNLRFRQNIILKM
jgi:hypothetical protein